MVPCGLVSPVVGTMLRVSSQYLFEEDKRTEREKEKRKECEKQNEGRKEKRKE